MAYNFSFLFLLPFSLGLFLGRCSFLGFNGFDLRLPDGTHENAIEYEDVKLDDLNVVFDETKRIWKIDLCAKLPGSSVSMYDTIELQLQLSLSSSGISESCL